MGGETINYEWYTGSKQIINTAKGESPLHLLAFNKNK